MIKPSQRVGIVTAIYVTVSIVGYSLCGYSYIPFLVVSAIALVMVSQSRGMTASRAIAHTGVFVLPTLVTGGFIPAFCCYLALCGATYLLRK